MDLKTYYRKLHQVEASIAADDVVVVSLATPDGGREGMMTEAPRAVAARLIVEAAARLATPAETAEFHARQRERQVDEEARRAAARIQVSVITEDDARAIARAERPAERPPRRKPAS